MYVWVHVCMYVLNAHMYTSISTFFWAHQQCMFEFAVLRQGAEQTVSEGLNNMLRLHRARLIDCLITSSSVALTDEHDDDEDEVLATGCNRLQRTTTHCNTLQHTATDCNRLQHTTTDCNTLQHTATHCNTLQNND